MFRAHDIRGFGRRRAFTLIEMLIVAALLAIFASLAIINMSTQLNLNKQKAAVGECRQIASALSFVNDDMGLFPKLNFLRFNLSNLQSEALQGTPVINNTGFEMYGNVVGDLGTKLSRLWKGPYLAPNSDKLVNMQFTANGVLKSEKWPADPWGNPYVVYLTYTNPNATAPEDRERFIDGAGKTPNYAACVVSYGRNRVPGLGELPLPPDVQARAALRLYNETADPTTFQLLDAQQLNGAGRVERIDMIRLGAPLAVPNNPNLPRVRQPGADDRVFEF
jgi:prepilin-type N-terminal cleavage/methylation domain-containing protein